ncbi:DUF499 domain-containing protein [Nocardia jejuensis]|uniref:DUF499 domain-containing protein n=1 Tax=Nocardia jejuensis TaxID=328049 RepID=UPI000A589F08|nr:DUF499 domain-containing protein [Nocardia jejuensis]
MQGKISTPWWDVLRLREEILDKSGIVGDTQVSLFKVTHGEGRSRPAYGKADYYGEITYPTTQLIELLAKIAIRLGGGAHADQVRALTRLDQGMGGGKSHACIGAWHLATNPKALAKTDIGSKVFDRAEQALGRRLPRDLKNPHIVVLSCDNMAVGEGETKFDGPYAKSLYERFLWRLFAAEPDTQEDLYHSYSPYGGTKAKLSEAINAVKRPVLVIIDEVLTYIGDNLEAADDNLKAKDMAFLRAFTEAIGDASNAAAIVVMINSEHDLSELAGRGPERRADLEAHLQRNGDTTTVNENADFSAILRRRLFEQPDDGKLERAIATTVGQFQPVLAEDAWRSKVFGVANAPWIPQFAAEVARTYPFHPQLIHLAEDEWSSLSGFQQVRSTMKIFAATVHALATRVTKDEWVPLLIGPGDVPLSDQVVRDAVISSGLITDLQTQGNYRSIAQSDIVSLDDADGAARRMDLERTEASWIHSNPRAAERAATMIYLASIVGSRGGSRRGASDPEVKAATMVPDLSYTCAAADSIVHSLTDGTDANCLATVEILPGIGGQPRRYFLNTRQRLTMMVRAMRAAVTDADRDQIIVERIRAKAKQGQFQDLRVIRAETTLDPRSLLVKSDLDKARLTRLVILDPAAFTLGNGTESATVSATRALFGLGAERISVGWSSSLVFLLATARGRKHARQFAADYLARERVRTGPEAADDLDLYSRVNEECEDFCARLDESIARAFQHVQYLSQPDVGVERTVETIKIDSGTLDGDEVWEALAKAQKAFRPKAFTATALLHNLRDGDYQRPLSEIRDAFWNTPRLGLLPGGESDLKQAILDAVQQGLLHIVRGDGEAVIVSDLTGINFNAATYRLARPAPPDPQPAVEDAKSSAPQGKNAVASNSGKPATSATSQPVETEQILAFTLMKNLANDPSSTDLLAQVFRRLFDLIDREAITFLQGTMQLHLPSDQAGDLATLIRELGIAVNVRDK